MSAWMITNDHADLIATAYVQLVDPAADPQAVGLDLLRENMFSLLARYGTPVDDEALTEYTFTAWLGDIDLFWINKAASCADYQACEHSTWRDSNSYLRLMALLDVTGGRNVRWPETIPWGIDPEHRPQSVSGLMADRAAQLAQLRAASPLRPAAGRTHGVDGLPMFDHARQPRLL